MLRGVRRRIDVAGSPATSLFEEKFECREGYVLEAAAKLETGCHNEVRELLTVIINRVNLSLVFLLLFDFFLLFFLLFLIFVLFWSLFLLWDQVFVLNLCLWLLDGWILIFGLLLFLWLLLFLLWLLFVLFLLFDRLVGYLSCLGVHLFPSRWLGN